MKTLLSQAMLLISVLLVMSIENLVESFDGNGTYFKRVSSIKSNKTCAVNDLNDYDHIININPIRAGNSSCNSQLFASQRHITCPDVNTALKFHADSTAYVFASGANVTHYLKQDSMTSFKSQSKVGFFSSNVSELASIECLDGAGLAFTNVNSVKIHHVVFSYCGACRKTTSKEYTKKDELYLIEVKVGLYFYNGSDVTMCHVTVQHGPDAVGVVMYDVDGTVNVYNSTFYNNTCSEQSSPGGGGVVIEFSSCVPGNRECMEQTSHSANANYTFYHTTFKSNSANTLTSRMLPNKKTHEGFGVGGGMALFFRGNATGNSIEIQSCEFVGNKASSGGGLFIEFGDTSLGNSVDISSAHFTHNLSPAGVGGGGVRITSILNLGFMRAMFDPSIAGNRVNISGDFIENDAQKGGAISFSPAFQTRFLRQQTTALNIVDSFFFLNRALVGAAVHLEIHPLFVWGIVNFVTIKNSNFHFNTIEYASNPSNYDTGIGIVYASQVPVLFQDNIHFEDNFGTALALVSTFATAFNSALTFENNRGDTGGAIAFLGSSYAVVSNTTNMTFERNFAHKGGAIYNFIITQGNMTASAFCFIQNHDPLADRRHWGAKFTFIDNKSAYRKSNSIFSTSIYPCVDGHIEEGTEIFEDLLFCITKTWTFANSNCTNEIETEGNTYTFLNKSAITAYPGYGFELPIEVRDDLGHDITGSVGYTSTVPTVNNSQLAQVDPRFKLVSENFIVITGLENSTVNLRLQSSDSRSHLLQIEVRLHECPPGFHFVTPEIGNQSDHLGYCTCRSLYSYSNRLKCLQNSEAQIIWNYWIGFTEKSREKLVMNCLPHIFSNNIRKNNYRQYLDLPKLYNELDEAVCGIMNRTGVICGQCKENFSTAINSYYFICTPCDDETNFVKNIIEFMLFAYVPYIILSAIIVFFNLKLTSSASSGFILFAQMMSLDIFNMDNNARVKINTFGIHKAYLFVYGIFNFKSFADVMNPFCIGKHFSALDVLLVEYTSAMLPLLMIILIYALLQVQWKSIQFLCCCSKRCLGIQSSRSGRKGGNSLIHSFVAFIVLSYTKLSLITTKMLAIQRPFDEDGNYVWNDSRIYVAGHLSFASKEYFLPYGLIAMIVLVFFVLLPPLFLLGLPQLVDKLLDKERFSCFRRVWPTVTIHIFLDAFQGFYKPNRRPFAGLYFVFRLVILLTSTNTTILDDYVLQQFFITAMIILLAVFRPYKCNVFNIIDIMIFLNLAVINLISTYAYASYSSLASLDEKVSSVIYVIQYCLIWLPLIYMLSYLMYKLLVKVGVYQRIITKLQKYRSTSEDRQYLTNNSEIEGSDGMRDVDWQSSDQDSLSDSAMFSRAKDTNTFYSIASKKRLCSVLDEGEKS